MTKPDTLTKDTRKIELASWLVQQGLLGVPNSDIMEAYCHKLLELGVPLKRMHATQSALHPVYGAVGFDWQRQEQAVEHEYVHNTEVPQNWLDSPFHHMLSNGLSQFREKIHGPGSPSRFPVLNEMAARGATDYYAQVIFFEDWQEGTPIALDDVSEGALMSWMADDPSGFSDADIALIHDTFPMLCLALKSGANRKTAQDLLGVYLGRDAGQRVLSGEIQRGSSRWIDAVICYFDLTGFTSMSQQIEGEALIAMLNDYFAVVVTQIESNGGDVLKFMGDGLIAIFDREALPDATRSALQTVAAFGHDMDVRNTARQKEGLPTLGYTVALHAGRVLYGNIGAQERLDFTVIGPEVNLAARLADMHRALGRSVIVSQAVMQQGNTDGFDLVSLGRYMLRGVDHPQELFTLYTAPVDTRSPGA